MILANVNAILGDATDLASARSEIYEVQDAIVSILEPTFGIRRRAGEAGIVSALVLWILAQVLCARRRVAKQRSTDAHQTP